MAGPQGPFKTTRLALDESKQTLQRRPFMVIRRGMRSKQFQKRSPMHTGAIAPIGNGVKSCAVRCPPAVCVVARLHVDRRGRKKERENRNRRRHTQRLR